MEKHSFTGLADATEPATAARNAAFEAGISTCVVWPASFDPARHLPLIARAGFASVELCGFQGERDFNWRSAQTVREIGRIADSEGVRISSVHACGEYPRKRFDEALQREYVDTTKAFCDVAAQLKAGVLVMHSLKPSQDVPADWAKSMRTMLSELAQYARPRSVMLGVENLNWLVVPSEDIALVNSQPPDAAGFVLDTGHAELFGVMEEYLTLAGARLCGLHIQDTDGAQDRHWLPGQGRIDWKRFMARLVEIGYAAPLTIEVHKYHEPQNDLPKYLEECMSAMRMLQGLLPEVVRRK